MRIYRYTDNEVLWDDGSDTLIEIGARLSHKKFQYADLRHYNLNFADLSCTDLSHANLFGAYARNANLDYVNFSHADLSYMGLYSASLRGAIFNHTVIEDEELFHAPTIVGNLAWPVLITPKYMRIGCQRFTHDTWRDLTLRDIGEMARGAESFWKKYKETLLEFCRMQEHIGTMS